MIAKGSTAKMTISNKNQPALHILPREEHNGADARRNAMRPIVFALTLLAATAAFAQNSPANPPVTRSTLSVIHLDAEPSCPVAMSAQRAALGETIWTIALEDAGQPRDEAVPRVSGSGVHVELKAPRDKASLNKAIRQIDLEVSYVPPGGRILLLQADAGGDTSDRTKTFHLSADGGAAWRLDGDLLVGPSAGITLVHVLRIDYSDGTAWRASGEQQCSVEPNGFLLAGAK
jgi:hypothetical protein